MAKHVGSHSAEQLSKLVADLNEKHKRAQETLEQAMVAEEQARKKVDEIAADLSNVVSTLLGKLPLSVRDEVVRSHSDRVTQGVGEGLKADLVLLQGNEESSSLEMVAEEAVPDEEPQQEERTPAVEERPTGEVLF